MTSPRCLGAQISDSVIISPEAVVPWTPEITAYADRSNSHIVMSEKQIGRATSLCSFSEGCFITGYDAFARRPTDHSLVDPALKNHEELFGTLPRELSGDRGFHEHSRVTEELQKKIPVVSIPKSGG